MTVEPGKGGQKLLTKQIKKIEFLSRYIYENDYEAILEADGGINADNVQPYLQNDRIVACGGSWMVSGALIREGKFDEIENLVREAAGIVKEIRG